MQHWIFHDSGDGLDGTDGPTQEKKPARKKKHPTKKKKISHPAKHAVDVMKRSAISFGLLFIL